MKRCSITNISPPTEDIITQRLPSFLQRISIMRIRSSHFMTAETTSGRPREQPIPTSSRLRTDPEPSAFRSTTQTMFTDATALMTTAFQRTVSAAQKALLLMKARSERSRRRNSLSAEPALTCSALQTRTRAPCSLLCMTQAASALKITLFRPTTATATTATRANLFRTRPQPTDFIRFRLSVQGTLLTEPTGLLLRRNTAGRST